MAAIFKQTPSFPLYEGIKWKTRSLSLKCFFRFDGDFKTDSVFKWKTRSLSLKCFFRFDGDFKQTPSFSLYGGMTWKTRSLFSKCFFRFGGDFKIIIYFIIKLYGGTKYLTKKESGFLSKVECRGSDVEGRG